MRDHRSRCDAVLCDVDVPVAAIVRCREYWVILPVPTRVKLDVRRIYWLAYTVCSSSVLRLRAHAGYIAAGFDLLIAVLHDGVPYVVSIVVGQIEIK